MFSNKCTILWVLGCCLIAVIAAEQLPLPLVRHQRSSELNNKITLNANKDRFGSRADVQYERKFDHGSASVQASQDQFGRQVGGQYNHNLYTSPDGRGSIDAYANANRNFDHNRNDFGGGVRGRLFF